MKDRDKRRKLTSIYDQMVLDIRDKEIKYIQTNKIHEKLSQKDFSAKRN